MIDDIGSPDWVDFVGPFTEYRVTVDGYAVPRLTAAFGKETVALIVDHRFMAEFPRELVQKAAWLIANAQAIADG